MNKKTFLIKLRPLRHYYFGSDHSLGEGDNKNYLVTSCKWPQQTTVLGMLRYVLLRESSQHQLATADTQVDAAAAALIGEHGFRIHGQEDPGMQGQVKSNWGIIQNLSPVFLCKGEQRYYQAPFNLGQHVSIDETVSLAFGSQNPAQTAYQLKQYEGKKGIQDKLIAHNDAENPIDPETVFIPHTQIGIKKGEKGVTENKAYYKQTYFTLKDKWEFGCYLTLAWDETYNELIEQLSEPLLVSLGGERLPFRMEMTAAPQPFNEKELVWPVKEADDVEQVILQSDAWVDESILDACQFAIQKKRDFRFIQTSLTQTSAYDAMSEDNNFSQMVKSKKYSLLSRGSVLYPKPNMGSTVIEKLSLPGLKQVGYNYFIHLKKS